MICLLGFPRPGLFYETQKRYGEMYLYLVDMAGLGVYNGGIYRVV